MLTPNYLLKRLLVASILCYSTLVKGDELDLELRQYEAKPNYVASIAPVTDNVCTLRDPLLAVSTVAISADWLTSRNIALYPDRFVEVGPARHFIGTQPGMGRINTYFLSLIAVNALTRCFAPKTISDIVAVVVSVSHTSAAVKNYQIGAVLRF
jgi:hypothetical protein